MAAPPSYEESTSDSRSTPSLEKPDSKGVLRFSIREQVGTSRAQHVAAVVPKLLAQVRARAQQGLSKTTLVLLPSDQGTQNLAFHSISSKPLTTCLDCSQRGQLVGVPEDGAPLMIQMEGQQDGVQFWTQPEALSLLQKQMLAAISDDIAPYAEEEQLPERPAPVSKSSSFFSRKRVGQAFAKPTIMARIPPVSVKVAIDEVHFRSESEFGLFTTVRGQAVYVTVEVR